MRNLFINPRTGSTLPVVLVIVALLVIGGIGYFAFNAEEEQGTVTPGVITVPSTDETGDAMTEKEDGEAMMPDEEGKEGDAMTEDDGDAMEEEVMTDEGDTTEGDSMVAGELKTFELEGRKFSFTPNTIEVKKGDRVKVVFTSTDGFHDWVVDEFNAATARVDTGGTTEVEFVANQAGEFEFYCSVGSHRQLGMVGRLIVSE
jgi:plastocyanin